MSDNWKLPWAGGCRCGKVRLAVTQAPIMSAACHCTGCQSMSSSAYSLTLILPQDGLEVTRGEVVVGGLHNDPAAGGQGEHLFCDWCKTWMFTRPGPAYPFVNLRPSMLDEHAWFAPYIETFTAEKLPWASTPAVRSFETFPAAADFPSLMAEFARDSARPT